MRSLFILLASLAAVCWSANSAFATTLTITQSFYSTDAAGDPDLSCALKVYAHLDTAFRNWKGALWLKGLGWQKVDGVSDPDFAPIRKLLDDGYVVFSPEYRGTYDGVPGQSPLCPNVDREQQHRDIAAGFNEAQLLATYILDQQHGWLLLGESAGGHLAAWLSQHGSAANRALIRGVVTVNSPVSFWHLWSDVHGNIAPPYTSSGATLTVPGSSDDMHFPLAASAAITPWFIQKYYLGPTLGSAVCDPNTAIGSDCFTAYPAAPDDGFTMANTFTEVSRDDNLAPMFMLGSTADWITPPASIVPICEWQGDGPGSLEFDSYESVQACSDPVYLTKQSCWAASPSNQWHEANYFAKCGSSDSRFGLLEGATHEPFNYEFMDHVIDWADSSDLDLNP